MPINQHEPAPIALRSADLEFATVRDGVRIARLIQDPMPTSFGGGVIEFDGGEIPDWTLPYDEVSLVLSGELRVHAAQGVTVAAAGELLVIPKGATVTYAADPGTRLVYVVHPRDWHLATD